MKSALLIIVMFFSCNSINKKDFNNGFNINYIVFYNKPDSLLNNIIEKDLDIGESYSDYCYYRDLFISKNDTTVNKVIITSNNFVLLNGNKINLRKNILKNNFGILFINKDTIIDFTDVMSDEDLSSTIHQVSPSNTQ